MAFVDTPIEMRQHRDGKVLCDRARRDGIMDMTGVDDPYEPPRRAATALNTVDHSHEENSNAIVESVVHRGFLIHPGFRNQP